MKKKLIYCSTVATCTTTVVRVQYLFVLHFSLSTSTVYRSTNLVEIAQAGSKEEETYLTHPIFRNNLQSAGLSNKKFRSPKQTQNNMMIG